MTAVSSNPVWSDVRTVDVRGARLAFREAGRGESVVFVHGGLSDLRTWNYQLTDLSDQYRTLSLSRRYARPNDDIPDGVDDQVVPHADDLAAFVRAVGAAPAHLVGNSWGGLVCLLTAIRHPDVVRSLVLEEPAVLPLLVGHGARPQLGATLRSLAHRPRGTLAVLHFGATAIGPARQAFRKGDPERAWRTFVKGVLGPDGFARMPEERLRQMRENASALSAQFLGAGWPPLPPEDVRAVRVPVLLVTGTQSPAFLGALTEAVAELLPQAQRVAIPEASHVMHEENPAAVNTALRTFLGGIAR